MLDWIEAHPGLAAWVQGVGTLLAVMAALAMPWIERGNHETRAAQLAKPVLDRSIIALIFSLDYGRLPQHEPDEHGWRTERLKEALVTLKSISAEALNPKAALSLQSFTEMYEVAVSELESQCFDPKGWADKRRSGMPYFAEALRCARAVSPQIVSDSLVKWLEDSATRI